VNFEIARGETFSLVGESGCGKSTVARLVVGLYTPTRGDLHFEGRNIAGLSRKQLVPIRRKMQMIFQDPYASLNPRWRVVDIIAEPLRFFGLTSGEAATQKRVGELLNFVGLSAKDGVKYPHEFSGGQRQRIGIARALILGPEIVVLDEPVSALDVSIRAQIINLLLDLQDQFGLSYLMISHDLSVVEHMSDRVAVMFFGEIVETGPWQAIFTNPIHPYCRRLIATIPDPDVILGRSRKPTDGEQPAPPAGWRFADDGLDAPDLTQPPPSSELVEMEPGHFVRLARA
jgi:peptide/nickel transport system ATP-binding protein